MKPSSYTSEWNVPDWQDRTAYEEMEGLSDTLWRWEFLRRSPDYRRDWRAHAQGTYELELRYRAGNPEKVLPWDHPDFRARINYLTVSQDHESRFDHACEQLHRYGLFYCGMPNPAVREPFPLDFDRQDGWMIEGTGDDIGPIRVNRGQVIYCFDLTRPLAPQIKKAEHDLTETQEFRLNKKIGRRVRKNEWPDYLRVIDARATGATFAVIGKAVFRVKDYNEAAARAKKVHETASHLAFNFPA